MKPGGVREMGQKANLVRRAFNGDREAALQIIDQALGIHREELTDIYGEVEYHRQNTWDEDGARELAFGDADAQASPEQVLGAFSKIHTKLLFLSAAIPVMVANKQEADAYEPAIRETAMDLFLLLHAPEIRYSIVGGFRPELREDVDDYLDRMGIAVWGTVDALLAEDLDRSNFPPETRAVMEQMESAARERAQDRQDD